MTGLIIKGYFNFSFSRSKLLSFEIISNNGVLIPFFWKIFFVIDLSKVNAHDSVPDPVYLMPLLLKIDWIFPSSPPTPCSAINATEKVFENISCSSKDDNSCKITLRFFLFNA